MKKEYKSKEISLNKDRRLIYAIKKAGLETYNPQGAWNGWGYEKLPMVVKIKSIGEMRKFNRIKKELEEKPAPRVLTEEEKKLAWAKRLVKLAPEKYGLTLEEALEIADEKLKYKEEEINKLEQRQINIRYSTRRQSMINKKYRENPLRWIKDECHAEAIILANIRHTQTGYDLYLEEAHEMEEWGEIGKGTARQYAMEKTYQEIAGRDYK